MRSFQSLTLAVWALTAAVGAGVVTEIVRPREPAAPMAAPAPPVAQPSEPYVRDVGPMQRSQTYEPGGWTIAEVHPDRIVFTRGEERLVIPVDPR